MKNPCSIISGIIASLGTLQGNLETCQKDRGIDCMDINELERISQKIKKLKVRKLKD